MATSLSRLVVGRFKQIERVLLTYYIEHSARDLNDIIITSIMLYVRSDKRFKLDEYLKYVDAEYLPKLDKMEKKDFAVQLEAFKKSLAA